MRITGALPVAQHLRPAQADEAPDLALLCIRLAPGLERVSGPYRSFKLEIVPLALVAALPIAGEA